MRSRHAFYNESNLHSDTEACLEFLEKHDFGFVHQVLTVQGVRDDSLTSYSMRFSTHLPFRLFALVHYGPKYLSAEEIRERIRLHLIPYYEHLAGQVFRRREPEFWAFHRRKMAEVGCPLSRLRVARYAAALRGGSSRRAAAPRAERHAACGELDRGSPFRRNSSIVASTAKRSSGTQTSGLIFVRYSSMSFGPMNSNPVSRRHSSVP